MTRVQRDMGGAYSVEVADLAEIQSSREEWNRLVDAMRFPTPFATWEWVTAWHEQFQANSLPWVLFVRQGGRLLGILPLTRPPRPVLLRWLMGSLAEMLGAGQVGADHLDLIVEPGHAPGCAQAINEFLRKGSVLWRELHFPLVTADSELHAQGGQLGSGLRNHVRRRSTAPYLPIAGTFEDYLQGLSSNERYKLRSRTRKLLGMPGVEYHRFKRDERDRALDLLFALHHRRSEEKSVVSSFARPEVEAFHRRLLAHMPWDQVVLRGLRRDSEVFAMFYGYRVGQRMFYFQLGYDPAWSATSPGLVLLTRTIREAFDIGCVEYNFLQGDESFKQTWTKESRSLFDCRLYSDGLRGTLSYQRQRLRECIKQRHRATGASTQAWLTDALPRPGQ